MINRMLDELAIESQRNIAGSIAVAETLNQMLMHSIAQLRHAYTALNSGSVVGQKQLANRLISSEIQRLESIVKHMEDYTQEMQKVLKGQQ